MKIFTAILLGTVTLLAGCDSSSSESVQKNYEHYSGGNFGTMQSCLDFVAEEAQSGGMSLKISSDKPNKVRGSYNGNSEMFFHCEKKETGTKGTFFEAAYPRFN